jgi:conjugal transfer pilus assembly protein TraV
MAEAEMNMPRGLMLMSMAMLITAGCAPKFNCTQGMKGPGCRSVSQVYDEAHHKPARPAPDAPAGFPQTIKPGGPLRDAERVLRVWMAPWVDVDGDYHDQSYVYLVLDHGRWFIDKERLRIRQQFAPHVIPPGNPGQTATGGAAAPSPDVHPVSNAAVLK